MEVIAFVLLKTVGLNIIEIITEAELYNVMREQIATDPKEKQKYTRRLSQYKRLQEKIELKNGNFPAQQINS